MVKIRTFTVSIDRDVSFSDDEFKSFKSFKNHLTSTVGEEDIYGISVDQIVKDLKKDGESIFEDEVWFQKYEVLN